MKGDGIYLVTKEEKHKTKHAVKHEVILQLRFLDTFTHQQWESCLCLGAEFYFV